MSRYCGVSVVPDSLPAVLLAHAVQALLERQVKIWNQIGSLLIASWLEELENAMTKHAPVYRNDKDLRDGRAARQGIMRKHKGILFVLKLHWGLYGDTEDFFEREDQQRVKHTRSQKSNMWRGQQWCWSVGRAIRCTRCSVGCARANTHGHPPCGRHHKCQCCFVAEHSASRPAARGPFSFENIRVTVQDALLGSLCLLGTCKTHAPKTHFGDQLLQSHSRRIWV